MANIQESYPTQTTGLGIPVQVLVAGNFNVPANKATVPGYNRVLLSLSGTQGPQTFQLTPQITDVSGAEVNQGTAYTLASVAASSGPGTITVTAVAASSGGTAVYTVTSGGTANQWVGFTFNVTGFTNAQNNGVFQATASSSTSLTLKNTSAIAETHAATAASEEGTAVYTGTFTGETTGSLVGKSFTVAGFTNAVNNGTFIATANSGTTTLTLDNADAIVESHAAVATAQETTWTAAITSVATGTGVYTGTFTEFAAYVPGSNVTISGFVTNAANNGTFKVISATATTLTTSNTASVSETHAASAVIDPTAVLTYVVYPTKTLTGNTYQPSGTSTPVATISSTGLLTAVAVGHAVAEVSFPFANNTAGATGAITPNPMTGLPAQKIYAEVNVTVEL